jgi:hypothetical protein
VNNERLTAFVDKYEIMADTALLPGYRTKVIGALVIVEFNDSRSLLYVYLSFWLT